jgi:primosomal replication protein N
LTEPANKVELAGVIMELKALRHTPAGIPVVEFRLRHASERLEAGKRRQVEAEIDAVAFEAQARLIAGSSAGKPLRAEGFLCAKSRQSSKPVLHVTHIEFVKED